MVWRYQIILGPKYHRRKIEDFWKFLNNTKSSYIPKCFCTNSFYYLVNSLSLPNFILIFISKNWFDSFSLIFWHAPILLDVILQALILCLHFFKCFALHYTIMASHKLIWIIVSGSSFQKLTSSTIILLTLTLRISISLLKNATLIKITKNVHHHLLRKHYEFFNHLTFNKIKTKF